MTKDEMKNRISMALKDSILQQGFEIICKENAQLIKAKEIIEKFYSQVFRGMGFMENNDYSVQKAEVEQFLNSEVIDDR